MYARTGRNRHWKGGFYTLDSLYCHRMSHTHTRTEVGIGNSLRRNSLQQGTHNRIASRIPTGRNNRNSIMCFCLSIQCTAQCRNTGMNIEAVHCMDAKCQYLFSIFLNATRRSTKDGHIHILQLFDIFHYGIFTQFCRTVLCPCTTYYSCDFEIGSCL